MQTRYATGSMLQES